MKLASVRNFLKDSSVAKWRKALLVGAVAYAIWPFDLIPDTIPVLGWMDDVGLLSFAIAMVWRDVKRHSDLLDAPAVGTLERTR
jgi:uncharacterized membrane protein YkvA (DUF1232 family)